MIVANLLEKISNNPKLSNIGSLIADFIFPDKTKNYPVLSGPGRNLWFKLNARTQTAILFGVYEQANVKFLLNHVSDKAVLWDVGAYIGYFTYIMSRRLINGWVVAVEPVPENIKLLYEHSALNNLKNVLIIEKALSSYEGSASFSITQSTHQGKIAINKKFFPTTGIINVPVTTIDALVNSGVPLPNIIKIDAEGEEGRILQGAALVFRRYRPRCLIEVHTPEAARLCWDFLSPQGYSILLLNRTSVFKADKPEDICYRHIWAEPIR